MDLQVSMAQGAAILARWANLLGERQTAITTIEPPIDFAAEAAWWQEIANEFTIKTRLMWRDGWFRDYDSRTKECSSQQDTIHLAPVFCGAARREQIEQLRPYFSSLPQHSGWAPLSWPPVIMTLVEACAAQQTSAAAELAYRFSDSSYRSTDRRELDEHGGLPGVSREYRQAVTAGKWGETEYVNAGIEGYGWGALSVHLLMRHVLGLREAGVDKITIAPVLPQALRRIGATYQAESVQWGKYTLGIQCVVRDAKSCTVRLRCTEQGREATIEVLEEKEPSPAIVHACEWEGIWGEQRTLQLPHLTIEKA